MSQEREPRSLEELCIDAAIWGSDLEIAAELREHDDVSAPLHEFELAAACATVQLFELAAGSGETDSGEAAMPARLRALLDRRAAEWCGQVGGKAVEPTSGAAASARRQRGPTAAQGAAPRARAARPRDVEATSQPNRAWIGWTVAAAALLVAAIGWLRVPIAAPPPSVDLVALRAELLAEPDVSQHAWARGPSPFAGAAAEGDVVWSDQRQAGIMRFRGLPPTVPGEFQYQLWIFDGARDAARPVDGGVFDVPSSGAEVLVPIHAKLRVFEGKAFAVTRERAGGVVVSDREHIVRVANL